MVVQAFWCVRCGDCRKALNWFIAVKNIKFIAVCIVLWITVFQMLALGLLLGFVWYRRVGYSGQRLLGFNFILR